MKHIELLGVENLPSGFAYPREFQHLLELGLTNLEPWYVLDGVVLLEARQGLAKRYPRRDLVPFARRQDNDDAACWKGGDNSAVFIIHDFADAGWEERGRFPTFHDWFRRAIEDLIEFDV